MTRFVAELNYKDSIAITVRLYPDDASDKQWSVAGLKESWLAWLQENGVATPDVITVPRDFWGQTCLLIYNDENVRISAQLKLERLYQCSGLSV